MNFKILFALMATLTLGAADLGSMKRAVCVQAGWARGDKGWQRCLSSVRQFGKVFCMAVQSYLAEPYNNFDFPFLRCLTFKFQNSILLT
jgi:hypothetical protein